MNNVSKTWVDPINMNASELNRIEQLIMNTHSNTAILNGEVSTLQNKYLQLSTTLNSLLGSQDTLKTLSELTKLASNNLDILDTLNNTTKLVKASSQEFTKEELTQIYDNLHLNSFLHLKDIRVNGESVIKGSIADIQIATIINNTQSSTSSSSSGSSNSSSDTGSTPSGGTISNKLSDMIQDDLYQTISQEDRDKWNLITKAVFNETDPTVPTWAKQESKPTYLYEEILNRPQKLSELTDDLNYATPSYVDTKVSDLQELLLGPGSTEAIDTIQELATEIQNNSEILDTLNQAITNKAPKDHTHTKSEITDFTHTHTKSDITDFAHNQSITTITNSAGNTFTSAKVASSISHTGWTNNATDDRIIPTMSFLAYWNGAHTSSNNSNLQYCKYGEIVGTTTNQTISGIKTFNAPTNSAGVEQTTMKIKTSNGGAVVFGKEGVNSGTMIRLDQTDGTCRLRFRSSATAGAMVWEQPEKGAQLYVDLGLAGDDYKRITFPNVAGRLLTVNGDTMTGPIVLNDGDGTTKGNIQLLANGQITDGSTATLFGRVSSSANNLIVGHGNYIMQLRGKNTRPTYNGNELALKSDAAGVVSKGSQAPQQNRTQAYEDVYTYNTYSTHNGLVPTNYTSVIGFGDGAAGTVEIAGCWTSEMGLWYRALRDCTDNWWPWQQIITQRGGSIASGYTLTINGTLVI